MGGMIAGGDGCRGGWIAAIRNADGTLRVERVTLFTELASRNDIHLIVVDIPIGLLDRGVRRADAEARRLLGSRHSCVFNAPIRPILPCATLAEASARWLEADGKRLSAQGWGIVPKVREVDAVVRGYSRMQERVREGHPEVTFAVMNEGVPLSTRKKDSGGHAERLKLLSRWFGETPPRWLDRFPGCRSDVLDAFAMLWTADRVLRGVHRTLPEGTIETDPHGLRAEMVI